MMLQFLCEDGECVEIKFSKRFKVYLYRFLNSEGVIPVLRLKY